jgi:hypothetical protein
MGATGPAGGRLEAGAPVRLADYRGRHAGGTILVCGCGRSLVDLECPERFTTIGVNDVGRMFDPTYLVVVNGRSQFGGDRFRYVEQSNAHALFTQLDLGRVRPPVVRFRLGRYGGTEIGEEDVLHYTRNSPYVAVCLAAYLGARRIGLIGVDFGDDHFFGATGHHPLAGQLPRIEREYAALAAACGAAGVELANLSPRSRLRSVPQGSLADWTDDRRTGCGVAARERRDRHSGRRVFFVHYRFLSCGTVFEAGLREAASQLGVAHEHAYWDDAKLPDKVERFAPDLIFVVHGRRYVQRWGRRFAKWRSAVWLLDEPYEVDETSGWSGQFDTVFVNDSSTLARHRHAHELPVAYAPTLHHGLPEAERPRRVGFIGGANAKREAMLAGLARRGLLDHVIGGPWRDARLAALCVAPNVPAERTAALYRETAIVVNVFRDRHHYNRAGLPALAMNPRIVEALACGALVVSEPRQGLASAVPELPTFRNEAEAAELIERFLAEPEERLRVQRACAARLVEATYSERLRTAMDVALAPSRSADAVEVRPITACADALEAAPAGSRPGPVREARVDTVAPPDCVEPFDGDWDDLGGVVRRRGAGELVIDAGTQRGPGFERGLTSRARYEAVELTFEASLEPGALLLAKVHQAHRVDQTSNSYHLLAGERHAYLARHHHVFREVEPPRSARVRWRLVCDGGVLELWRNDRLMHRVRDRELDGGYAFIGAQGGTVLVRGLELVPVEHPSAARTESADEAETLRPVRAATPRLSIVTTVYDRTDCLRHCIASVQRLAYRDYEHLIVADHPAPDVVERIRGIVAGADDPRIGLFNLRKRHNNWGIAPAAAGLRRSRGEFVSFLSDDNGYLPDHFEPLVRTLDRTPALGFVYSSCQYDGRLVLAHPVPRPGRIDLGQLLFRRELFELHLNDDLPFDMMAWDWHLVDTLMRRGVRWRHLDRPSFIFRLGKYPRLRAA